MKKGIMILGHGSRYSYNKWITEVQKDRLEEMGFENVYIGFNETSFPSIESSLDEMVADGIDEIVAVPFFIASGLHMTRDIPGKLKIEPGSKGGVADVNGKKIKIHFEEPFGKDPLLSEILLDRIKALDSGTGRTAVLVIGHGSRLPYNKETIIFQTERLSEAGVREVRYAFNEFDEPKIPEVMDEMISNGADEIIVLPLFISLGAHLKNDIPVQIGVRDGESEGVIEKGQRRITVKYASPIGEDPRLTDTMAEKIRKYM